MLQFLAGCSDSKLLAAGLHHMHRACSASALLCDIWGGQGSMELALAVAADTTWPVRVRRTALLLVSVLCRGSPQSAKHFLLLGVCGGHCPLPACLTVFMFVRVSLCLCTHLSVCVAIYLFVETVDSWDACVQALQPSWQRHDPFAAIDSPGPRCLVIPLCLL